MLGAFWENRVAWHLGGFFHQDATSAPTSAQVSGLQDTIILVVFIILAALIISLWALRQVSIRKKNLNTQTL